MISRSGCTQQPVSQPSRVARTDSGIGHESGVLTSPTEHWRAMGRGLPWDLLRHLTVFSTPSPAERHWKSDSKLKTNWTGHFSTKPASFCFDLFYLVEKRHPAKADSFNQGSFIPCVCMYICIYIAECQPCSMVVEYMTISLSVSPPTPTPTPTPPLRFISSCILLNVLQ